MAGLVVSDATVREGVVADLALAKYALHCFQVPGDVSIGAGDVYVVHVFRRNKIRHKLQLLVV